MSLFKLGFDKWAPKQGDICWLIRSYREGDSTHTFSKEPVGVHSGALDESCDGSERYVEGLWRIRRIVGIGSVWVVNAEKLDDREATAHIQACGYTASLAGDDVILRKV